ncbi:trans-sulfuration enzyme family protein [Nioella nitratireducens]|uniref:trans-sulfuration enzyme family protein n=1 Tax=Nioella nitratireducens TaxID=1287720 RepID=UPI0008FD5ED4|nr:aminotransferase class I/II-fold pyridoxal phosphate-dependent enzyme [Nioella nitratireducens]
MSDGSNLPKTLVRRMPLEPGVSRPVVTPIQPSVVYSSESPDQLEAQYEGKDHGYTYSREGHPNADLLAAKIDMMEGGKGGIITASGMAAVGTALMGLLSQGDHVIGGDQLYGRSLRMMTQDLPRFGIASTLVDTMDPEAVKAAIRPETKMILVEVMSNPTLRIADMEAIARICAETGILLAVDNTFTTPQGYRPYDHGADIVIHSVTKLLAGHADVTLGYVSAKDPEISEKMRVFWITMGATPSPNDCWLAERGIYTFDLRYQKSQENAAQLADFLADQPGVKRVIYPGRKDHPEHQRAAKLLNGEFGNMVSFEVEGGRAAANALVRAMPEVAFAPTLGDVGTTVSHPATSSHRLIAEADRQAVGITEGFFRVSVGIEDIEILKADFGAGCAAAAAL